MNKRCGHVSSCMLYCAQYTTDKSWGCLEAHAICRQYKQLRTGYICLTYSTCYSLSLQLHLSGWLDLKWDRWSMENSYNYRLMKKQPCLWSGCSAAVLHFSIVTCSIWRHHIRTSEGILSSVAYTCHCVLPSFLETDFCHQIIYRLQHSNLSQSKRTCRCGQLTWHHYERHVLYSLVSATCSSSFQSGLFSHFWA